MDRHEISEVKLGKIELFEVWSLIFSIKEEIMRKIHNWNVTELARCIIVFYPQEKGTCFVDIVEDFSWVFIFLSNFEASLYPLNLKSIWQLTYSTVSCCLMEWPANDILILLQNYLRAYCLWTTDTVTKFFYLKHLQFF